MKKVSKKSRLNTSIQLNLSLLTFLANKSHVKYLHTTEFRTFIPVTQIIKCRYIGMSDTFITVSKMYNL